MKQFGFILIFLLLIGVSFGQSTNQDFPSPVLKDAISGTIAARDIGDSRLTRHFYVLYAGVGDLFLNVESANFNGDIDLFEATTLRPISKISIYAAESAATTSRIVYFRQRTRVVMRIEGRTTNDEAARYRINFSGSFAAATDLPQPPEDLEPKVSTKASDEAVARVNSAGAIIEVLPPKNQPEPEKTEPEKTETEPEKETENAEAKITATPRPARTRKNTPARRTPRRTTPPKTETATTEETTDEAKTEAPAPANPRPPRTGRNTTARRNAPSRAAKTEATAEPKVDPLASVQLVVLLKDGYKIERPMSEILRVSVDKGTLVVVAKSGKIERFPLLDVLRFSIEQ